MARPKVYDRTHLDLCRQKIQTTQLLNRLQANALGEITLDSVQQRSIEILLRKALPDLSAIEHSGEVAQPYAQVLDPIPNAEWQNKYKPPTAH